MISIVNLSVVPSVDAPILLSTDRIAEILFQGTEAIEAEKGLYYSFLALELGRKATKSLSFAV
jgi:hypothetical protein